MQLNGLLQSFPKELKLLIAAFVVVLSVGFYIGLLFVGETSGVEPNGIEEQYLGNEADEDAKVMKFKKSAREMLSIIHTHILSMSFIFFLLGIILVTTRLNKKLKIFLLIEPFVSVVMTFGGLYFLWLEYNWMRYIVMFSGILMTMTFVISTSIIFVQLCKKG
jgi:hypothetical protein